MNAKLTAYALNELPPDERAALEAEMETNPALRAEAEEMRKFCSVIHEEVTAADKVALTAEQRVRVLREFTAEPQSRKTVRSVWRHPAFWVPTAIAACTTLLLVIKLNHERSSAAKEMQVMQARPEVERLEAGTSPERVLVTLEKTEKAVGQESQTPAPGKPEMPALVAANSPVSLGIEVKTLPPMPAPTVANDGAVILPKSMGSAGATFSGVVTSPVLAANEPASTPMAVEGNYGGVSPLARGTQSETRGIEMGASRPLERYNLSPEKLGEVPAEIRMGRVPSGSVDVNGRTDLLKRSPEGLALPPSESAPVGASSLGSPHLAFGSSLSEPSLGIASGGIVLQGGSNTYTGGLTINGGVTTAGSPAASINGNGTLQTDGGIANLADLPAMGQSSQITGGIVKSGAGTLAISSPTKNAPAIALPAGAEPFGPGFAVGIFGAGILPESGEDDALGGGVRTDYFFNEYIGATGNFSPQKAPAPTVANSSSMAPAATTDGRVTFGKGTIAGTGGTSLPANNDFALVDANKPAAKAKTAAGRQLDAPMDLAEISSPTPAQAPAPTAKPVESKAAAPSRATTLSAIVDNMPDVAGAAPASPAPMAGTAGAAAPATTTAAPVIGDPYIALNEPKLRVMAESLAPTEKELGELKRLQETTELRIKQLKDSEARARVLATRSAGGETYTPIYENPFLQAAQQPLSTFSIDVDTASYANVRRFLNNGQRPPADAVRLEELINYFPYAYEPPAEDGAPFSVTVDMVEAPWQPMHRLARIALKGREIHKERGAANFVFLVDVSGSMDEPDKLPLVKQSLRMLTEQIKDTDRVAIVTYAGESGVALGSTPGSERKKIQRAIEKLGAGGSTNGAGGIRMAYQQAAENFVQEGVNRVILCTDGDFNVGLSSPEELEKLIAEKAKSRVFLSVLGYGTGNLKDRTMETLADKGNGNYAYIDSLSEARKVLVDQMNATLVTIAKDVKIQVEFNPAQVAAYRLLGYENRALAKEDFNNDRKDAGEIGAGHTVTALYEIVPAGARLTSPDGRPMVDDLKYAPKPAAPAPAVAEPTPAPGGSPSKETMTVKLRYKQPEGDRSQLIEVPVIDKEQTMANAPRDLVFAASVTGFGMLLRNSQYASELTWDMVRDMAIRGKGEDPLGYRGEFLQLIDKARGLTEGRE